MHIPSGQSSHNLRMSKVTVSLPEDLLQDIDEEARRRSMSRSAFLATAARRELARREPEAVAQAVSRSEQRFRAAGVFNAAELVRQERDGRW
jgi:predicted transcriptional regulator